MSFIDELPTYWPAIKTAGSYAVTATAAAGITAGVLSKAAKSAFARSLDAHHNSACIERHTLTLETLHNHVMAEGSKVGSIVFSTGEQAEVICRDGDDILYGSFDLKDVESRTRYNQSLYHVYEPRKMIVMATNPSEYPVSRVDMDIVKSYGTVSWSDPPRRGLMDSLFDDEKNSRRVILKTIADNNVKALNTLVNLSVPNRSIGNYVTIASKYERDGFEHFVVMPANDFQEAELKALTNCADRNDPHNIIPVLPKVNEQKGISRPVIPAP